MNKTQVRLLLIAIGLFLKVVTAEAQSLKLADTSSMLSKYLRKSDTANMLSKYLLKSDTSASYSNLLRKSDTASMLSNYLPGILGVKYLDTASMFMGYARYGQIVKYSDTALMLTNYAKSDAIPNISSKVNYADTALIVSGYALSGTTVKYSDTALMLSNYVTSSVASNLYQPKGTYLTSIDALQVTNALGFTPYNSTNPNGYIAGTYTGFDSRYLLQTGGTLNGNLNVNGIITANKLTILAGQIGTWPDYVFSKTYKLKPLAEVDAYIKKFNRLPEMPSSADIDKNGINVADNQAMLLRKIEELTLYMLEIKKENEELKKRVNSISARKRSLKWNTSIRL